MTNCFRLALQNKLLSECWFGPTVAVLQSSVGRGKGGTAQGIFALTGAVGNLAPAVLGTVYGSYVNTGDGQLLSQLLNMSVCLGYGASAVCFAISAQLQQQQQQQLNNQEQ